MGKKAKSKIAKSVAAKLVKDVKKTLKPARSQAAMQIVRGAGDYATSGANLGRAVGSVADGISNSVRAFRRLFGSGSYSDKQLDDMKSAVPTIPRKNSLFHADSFDHPIMNLNGQQFAFEGPRPRLVHRELIGTVMTPPTGTVFATQSFNINPGLALSFPWLSQVASNFQAYVLNGLIIHFESTSSEFVSSSALGDITISSQYDMNKPPFDNEIEAKDSAYATYAKPSCSFIHPVECAKKMSLTQKHMIRTEADSVLDKDELLYDWCRVQISTSGVQTPATPVKLGNIYAVYDVTLEQPNLHPIRTTSNVSLFSRTLQSPIAAGTSVNIMQMSTSSSVANRYVNSLGLIPVGATGTPVASFDTAFGFAVPPRFNGTYLCVKRICAGVAPQNFGTVASLGSGVLVTPNLSGVSSTADKVAKLFPISAQYAMQNPNGGTPDTCYNSAGLIGGCSGMSYMNLLTFTGTSLATNYVVFTNDTYNELVSPTDAGIGSDLFVIRLGDEVYKVGSQVSISQDQLFDLVRKYVDQIEAESSRLARPARVEEQGLEDSPYKPEDGELISSPILARGQIESVLKALSLK